MADAAESTFASELARKPEPPFVGVKGRKVRAPGADDGIAALVNAAAALVLVEDDRRACTLFEWGFDEFSALAVPFRTVLRAARAAGLDFVECYGRRGSTRVRLALRTAQIREVIPAVGGGWRVFMPGRREEVSPPLPRELVARLTPVVSVGAEA